MNDLLSLLDLTPDQAQKILNRAKVHKSSTKKKKNLQTLKGKSLALLFEKASTRTKVSFDVAMYQLGGHSIYLDAGSTQLGRGESYEDTGRVLSRYVDGIVIRTFGQKAIEDLARGASVPVINGLSDLHHPCQILADLLTILEVVPRASGLARASGPGGGTGAFRSPRLKISYIGDGNNVANTWMTAAMLFDIELSVATPVGHEPPASILKKIDIGRHANIVLTHDPVEAARDSDVINTDTWFSMGQKEDDAKRRALLPFQINQALLRHARSDAIVLHCLPAHRGEEIAADVIDGPQSRVWDQAENRLHVQKAVLEMFLK